jgi:hypothetical protein
MFKSDPGVKRPLLYILAAALGIAMAVPLAISSGQMQTGGIFDECFSSSCGSSALLANAD